MNPYYLIEYLTSTHRIVSFVTATEKEKISEHKTLNDALVSLGKVGFPVFIEANSGRVRRFK